MPDFLDSEAARWGIGTGLTVLVGIAAILVPILINRKRKTIWYQTSTYPLVRSGLDERIEIRFDGEPVPNVYATIIQLRYQGAEPIVEDNYRTPLTFDFGDARVLDAEIYEVKPDGLRPTLNDGSDDNSVVFDPLALNDGNRLNVRVLLTNENTPTVSGHIIGVNAIRHEQDRWDSTNLILLVFGLTFLFLIPAFIWSIVFEPNLITDALAFVGITIFATGFAIAVIWSIADMVIQARRRRY